MQDHPIDLIHAALSAAQPKPMSRRLGLITGVALILAFGLAALKPADAAGATLPVVTAKAGGHLGVTPLTLDGSVLAQTGVLSTAVSVCRLTIDPEAEAPLAASCAPPAEATLLMN